MNHPPIPPNSPYFVKIDPEDATECPGCDEDCPGWYFKPCCPTLEIHGGYDSVCIQHIDDDDLKPIIAALACMAWQREIKNIIITGDTLSAAIDAKHEWKIWGGWCGADKS